MEEGKEEKKVYIVLEIVYPKEKEDVDINKEDNKLILIDTFLNKNEAIKFIDKRVEKLLSENFSIIKDKRKTIKRVVLEIEPDSNTRGENRGEIADIFLKSSTIS